MPELDWVNAEEAAKWPVGTPILAAAPFPKKPLYLTFRLQDGFFDECKRFGWEYSHYCRLPETLPELGKEEG